MPTMEELLREAAEKRRLRPAPERRRAARCSASTATSRRIEHPALTADDVDGARHDRS